MIIASWNLNGATQVTSRGVVFDDDHVNLVLMF
jgi:hypothetical protein